MLVVLVGLLGAPGTAGAQDPDPPFRFEALVVGRTLENQDIPTMGRASNGGTGEFEDTQINFVFDCRLPNGQEEWAFGTVKQPGGHKVRFEADDDLTDGFGRIHSTDDSRQFEDLDAVEFRVGELGLTPANVRIRLDPDPNDPQGHAGRFHRLGNVVRVHLTLDIRLERDPDGIPGTGDEVEQCHVTRLPIRIKFIIVPSPDTTPTTGFLLVGVARDHLSDPDPIPDRFPCSTVPTTIPNGPCGSTQ